MSLANTITATANTPYNTGYKRAVDLIQPRFAIQVKVSTGIAGTANSQPNWYASQSVFTCSRGHESGAASAMHTAEVRTDVLQGIIPVQQDEQPRQCGSYIVQQGQPRNCLIAFFPFLYVGQAH